MPVNEQLREIFGDATQTEISAHLQARGLEEGSQTTVSAWLRGVRQPSNEQLAQIESIYGLERGTILVRAGFISEAAKELAPPAGGGDPVTIILDYIARSDVRFDDAVTGINHSSETLDRLADLVHANRQQLVTISEHLGLPIAPVVPAPTRGD